MTSDGPCQPWRMEIPAAPALAIIMGTSRGETRRAPFSLYTTDLFGQGVEAADAGGEDDAGLGRIGLDVSGVLHRHVGRGDAELGEAVELARFLGPEPLLGFEVAAPHRRRPTG